MDTDPTAYCIVGLITSFLLSTLFSIIKIVFLSIDKNSLPVDSERLRFYASKIEDIQEKRSFLNATVSFGKTLANTSFAILAFYCTTSLYSLLAWYQSAAIACAISLVILSVFAYTIPRALALRFLGGEIRDVL